LKPVSELVEELLRFSGFSIKRDERFLVASKGSIRVLVRVEGEAETIDGHYIEELRHLAEGRSADRILLIHTGNVAQDARTFLERYHIVLWDRERFSLELGRALLAAAEDEIRGPELPFIDYLVAPERPVEEPVEAPEIRVEEPGATEVGAPAIGAVAATGQSDILEFLEVETARVTMGGEGERYIEVRLTPEEALERAKRLSGAERCDLQFVPYHLFDYQVELEDEAGDTVVMDNGTLAVNALTGQAQEWNIAPRLGPGEPEDPKAAVLRPSIDSMAAYEQANRAIKDLHTRVVERVEERGTVTVFEKRHVKPRDGAIDIRARGLIFMPVWCIEAPGGVAIINANTGRVVKEEYLD
jgi:hypothetical protein